MNISSKDLRNLIYNDLKFTKQDLKDLINNELESIIKSSHDQKDSLIEKSATKLKETALKKTKEIVEKLENNSKI